MDRDLTLPIRTGLFRLASRLGVHVGRRTRWDLIHRGYESPVPDFDALPPEVWDRRTPLRGIRFDLDEQLSFAESELASHLAEFDPPHEPTGQPHEFFLWNTWFESVDAEVTYAMLRHLRPRRVIELGSGFSTLVLAQAARRNAAEGASAEFVSYNPYPPPFVERGEPGLREHRRMKAQNVPLSEFEALDERDVLFVDTSHSVRLDSEVNFIVLEVLPALRAGVAVHFHDISLPYEYPRFHIEECLRLWTEQYLLQAFLSGNDQWEILFAAQAIVREQPERLQRLVPSHRESSYPSSFWMRRVR